MKSRAMGVRAAKAPAPQAVGTAPKGLRPPNPPARVPPTLACETAALLANATPTRVGSLRRQTWWPQ
ncbi:MAG TPA: hypothetical protein VFU69_08115, partial [Ktedonobacterales bacterium]|nr:hypothetical protein [Ktedonobacterales bacterium]